MRILIYLLSVLISFGSVFAAEPSSMNMFEVLPRTGAEDVSKYFDAYGYRYTGGHYENELIPFRVYTPCKHGKYDQQKYPLVVFFHGRNNYGDNHRHLRCLRTVDFDGTFFLLAASCNDRHPFWGTIQTDPDLISECPAAVCMEIVRRLLEQFPIDPNEIHLIGYSDGTNAVSHFVEWGLKPKSAVYLGGEPPKNPLIYFDENGNYKRPETDLYFYYGKDDSTFPHGAIVNFHDKVLSGGGGEISVYRLSEPYNGHDVYKHAFGDYRLIQRLVNKNKTKK
jgi:predicted peptidase